MRRQKNGSSDPRFSLPPHRHGSALGLVILVEPGVPCPLCLTAPLPLSNCGYTARRLASYFSTDRSPTSRDGLSLSPHSDCARSRPPPRWGQSSWPATSTPRRSFIWPRSASVSPLRVSLSPTLRGGVTCENPLPNARSGGPNPSLRLFAPLWDFAPQARSAQQPDSNSDSLPRRLRAPISPRSPVASLFMTSAFGSSVPRSATFLSRLAAA
jgi:hypothetical protein